MLEQDQIGRRARDIGGAVDRDPDVGGVQRRRIVDAVAHEADDMAEPLQRQQDPKLLLRVDAAEQVDPRQLSDQRLLREMRQRVAGQHSGDRHADLGEDVAGHQFVVAGQHLHGDTRGRHRLDRRAGACFRRIEENSEAGENKVALVGDCGGLVARIDHAAGYAEGAESLRTERVKGGLEGTARFSVERQLLCRPRPRIVRDSRRRSSGAPLTIRRRLASCSTRTETRRRSKSNGTSSIFFQPVMSNG